MDLTLADNLRNEVFVSALTAHQSALRGYCQASLGNGEEAREALQRTNIVLWRKCRDWDPQTPFLRWAMAVARFEILAVVRDRTREKKHLVFDSDVVEQMSETALTQLSDISEREGALGVCMQKMSGQNKDVLMDFYVNGKSIREIAKVSGKGESAVKVLLFRLRDKLRQCIEINLAKAAQ